jgi:hypothetical protein
MRLGKAVRAVRAPSVKNHRIFPAFEVRPVQPDRDASFLPAWRSGDKPANRVFATASIGGQARRRRHVWLNASVDLRSYPSVGYAELIR